MQTRNRRVPPRGNPDETQQQQASTGTTTTFTTQVIPWRTLLITTGFSTVVGYIFLEVIRAAHGYVRRRREADILTTNPPARTTPGRLENGIFQLPTPEGVVHTPMSGPGFAGFARPQPQAQPQLVDVNNPMGAFQHQLAQMQRHTDQRFQRLEQMLQNAASGYPQAS